MRTAGLALALWLAATGAWAHLGTPWRPTGDVLRAARYLVLARVTGKPTRAGLGIEQPVERVADLAAPTAATLVIYQEGPHRHDLAVGSLVVLPLEQSPAGGWRYPAETREPLELRPGQQRPVAAFIQGWRAGPGAGVDQAIALLAHPAAIARRVGAEVLLAPEAASQATPDRLDRLLDPLLDPAESLDERLQRLRLAEVFGGQAGANAVAARFERLVGDRLRLAAAGVAARSPGPAQRRLLATCAQESGAVGARCARLLAGLPAAPPPAPAP
ncbi:MAG: hypothetical protein R3F60_05575 [bacterium]